MGAQNPSQPEEPHHESGGAGHSTPRIPGQRDRTAAPDNAPDDVDLGWVLHEGGGSGSFDGWLYHYADGTMVDAQGVEYRIAGEGAAAEESADSADSAAPADVSTAPGSSEDSETQPEREPETERPRLRAVADGETEPRGAGDGPSEGEQAAVAPEEATEGTTEGPAGSPDDVTEDSAEDAATDAPAEDPADAAPSEGGQAVPTDESASDPDPQAAADAAEENAPAAQVRRPGDVPAFVEYTPGSLRGYLLGGVFVVAAVTGVLTSFVAISESSTAALVVAAGCLALALVAWWALLSWRPVVVTVREGTLDITRGEHSETFDLTDPATVVEFRGRPGPSWTALVRHANGPRTVLRPSHVKPRQFERIVRHHRAPAEQRDTASA